MFSWFKKSPNNPSAPPAKIESNPGLGHEFKVAFANGERTWNESVDLTKLLASVLQSRQRSFTNHGSWLTDQATGILISPNIVELQPMDDGASRTVTTIQINHPTLIPQGVFEYQHSIAKTAEDSIRKGFEQWEQMDFLTLTEALSGPKDLTCMVMTFPPEDGRSEFHRRAILGPVSHYRSNPPDPSYAPVENEDEHEFCTCCLLTHSFQAYNDHWKSNEFVAIRMYACRGENGEPLADCRVNGENYEPGAEALRDYVESWPDCGFEFRKQYVVLSTVTEADLPKVDRTEE